ncbi:right-handed parallel beta-helix repeat-containing protein [Winogradskya humida]|uniref:Parallel beta helix pectate lyase-like protein n=1 Tax=Winogradskya humida TaxID=113566 RepID=A0ABQ3ZUC5_9ACTN|nr:right-handed parallel beta-helix repeat-containing protein [Actinoplanes humidus]GIE22205.1 hypothetical protein Ahu01nite_053070 [Actinoplanes humidus]
MRLSHTVRLRVAVIAAAVALPAAFAAMAAAPAYAASAAVSSAAPAYSLTSSVSPAAMTFADCAADSTCVVAAAPKGGAADDYTSLSQAVASAASRTRSAVVAADGSVTSAPVTATVLLRAGTYRLTKGLALPVNVNLRGAGITATSLVMDPTVNWKNFSFGFLVRPADAKEAGSTNLVADLTVNGNCRTDAGSATAADLPGQPGVDCDFRSALGASTNTGGGIKAGDNWTVRQVRFTNLEYFKLWVSQVKNVSIVDNRFDNWGGAESGDEDNIGGGRNDGVVIENNQFDATIRGNSFDFVNSVRTTVRNNVVHTRPAVAAARGVNEYGNMYFEGLTQAQATGNTLEGAHIVLTSNANYTHVAPNKDITNPRDNLIAGNRILDSYTVGVAIGYSDYLDADGTYGTLGSLSDDSGDSGDHYVRAGGNNVVRDNVIERSRQSGILVYGNQDVKTTADSITGNRVVDAGFGGSTEYNTGAGRVDTSGIALSVGTGDAIYGNTIVDDQAKPTTWYGVHLGARSKSSAPSGTVLTGPNGEKNTTSGIVGAAVRTAALAPEGATGLAADSNSLTWTESYAGVNTVAGYKVFRDGKQIADLPVGSSAVPANLMDDDAASLESVSGVSAWTAGSTTKIARNTSSGAIGGSSLALTATSAGQINVTGRKSTVTAGTTYTSVASFQASSTGRVVRAGLTFTDANGKVTRLATSNKAAVDSASGWVTSSYSVVAPAGSVSVQAFIMVEGASAGETHFLDRLGLVTGTATEQLSLSSSSVVAGSSYSVVSYRADSGDFSGVSSVSIS